MAVFDVTLKKNGKVETLPFVAPHAGEARLQAARQGLVLGKPKMRKERRGGGLTAGERYVMMHQLATMTRARMPLGEVLRLIRVSHGGRIGDAAAVLEAGVAQGSSIADLIYEDRKNFPGAVGQLVKAGAEGTGGLADALKKAAEFEREILNAATKGAKGLYQAGFWVVVATIALFACPLWLTPFLKDTQLFKLTDTPMDWAWLDHLAYAAGAFTLLLMLIGLFLFFIVGVGQRLFPEFSDKIVMRVPYLKDIVFTRDNFISLYRFALMVKAGVSMEEALATTHRDTRKGALKEDLGEALLNVKEGRPWASKFRTVHPTNKAALSIASDKEQLGDILEEVSEENRAIYVRRVELMSPILALIGGFSMVLVYAVSGLYSIVPFSELFERLMSDAQSF